MRLLSVALHEKAAPPALLRGSSLQRAPRKAGWCAGQGREGDGEKRREEKTRPEKPKFGLPLDGALLFTRWTTGVVFSIERSEQTWREQWEVEERVAVYFLVFAGLLVG